MKKRFKKSSDNLWRMNAKIYVTWWWEGFKPWQFTVKNQKSKAEIPSLDFNSWLSHSWWNFETYIALWLYHFMSETKCKDWTFKYGGKTSFEWNLSFKFMFLNDELFEFKCKSWLKWNVIISESECRLFPYDLKCV